MAKLRDGQRDFSGGMVDRIAPERLGENQYAYGKNVEVRYGGVRSRRGSWLLIPNAVDGAGDECEVMGAEIFRYPEPGVVDDLVQAIYRPDVDETRIYAIDMPSIGIRSELTIPETILGRSPMKMVQAYDRLYILRDGAAGWKWEAGDVNNPVEVVADGISGPMPTARDGVYAYNRLWLIEGDDTVIPSDLLDENWDRTTNEFRVEQGDGTRLVALRPFGGGTLLAFKERGVALIRGAFNFAEAGDLSIEFVSDVVGCVAADTAVSIGADVFFLGRDGVWSIQQTTEQNARLVMVPLSEPIYGLIQEINWQYADKASAALFDNYYLVAVPVGGATSPNRILVYDLLLKAWVGFWEHGESQAVNDDQLHRHFALRKARKGLRDELLTIGQYGNCGILLKGDYEDWEGATQPYVRFIASGLSPAITYLIPTIVGNGGVIPHTAGKVTITARADDNGDLNVKAFSLGGSSYFSIVTAAGTTTLALRIRDGGANGFDLDATIPDDGDWHTYEAWQEYIPGFGPLFFRDGVNISATYTGTGAGMQSKWLNDLGTSLQDCFGLMQSGEVNEINIEAFPWGVSGAYYNRFHIPLDEATGTQISVYRFNDNSGTTDVYTGLSSGLFSGNLEWDSDADDANITSVLKTRGMDFGDLLSNKSGLRGELRFAHGQPSVTMSMGSDVPFDTETLASLNAKTYSLTDYEVVGRSAWDATNTNNDFQTPYREDYAPIALGVQMGAAGLVLDKHREHTELFSSLAIFGWTQFTITNTQGFVRYNGLSLTAQGRNYEQDTGNNGN